MQAHLGGIIGYVNDRKDLETTASLRSFVESANSASAKEFNTHQNFCQSKFDELFSLDKQVNGYVGQVEQELNSFKLYCDNFKSHSIQELLGVEDA